MLRGRGLGGEQGTAHHHDEDEQKVKDSKSPGPLDRKELSCRAIYKPMIVRVWTRTKIFDTANLWPRINVIKPLMA